MSPEAEIPTGQTREALLKWISEKKIVPEILTNGPRTWVIEIIAGEPLVVYTNSNLPNEMTLSCSDRQARELEKAGIVKFPKPQRKK